MLSIYFPLLIYPFGNNAGWTQIARSQIQYLKDDMGIILDYMNYELVAKANKLGDIKTKVLFEENIQQEEEHYWDFDDFLP